MEQSKCVWIQDRLKDEEKPEVSVVIPFYENVVWLEEAVESVLAQTYRNWEIIVVNDGSSENVEKFLSMYLNKIRYIKTSNRGPAAARNEGIELARGKYIAFLDSDDLWMKNKLEVQIKEMKRYNAIWSYCGWNTFGIGRKVKYEMTRSDAPIFQKHYNPHIATPSVVVKKQFFIDYPDLRFNTSLRYGQDGFLWRLISAKTQILAIPDELVSVRMRGKNASKCARIQLRANGECWEIQKKNRKEYIDNFDISYMFMIASELCSFGNRIAFHLEKLFPEYIVELVSKFLYILPYVLYKIDRKISDV